MEDFYEREVHSVVHPEDGHWRKVWRVQGVNCEKHVCQAEEYPARDVARVHF